MSDQRRTGTQASPVTTEDLLVLASTLDDLEAARIAADNRRDALLRKGIPYSTPEVMTLKVIALTLLDLEKKAEHQLEKLMRRHPLDSWRRSDAAKGVGAKQLARFLSACKDPLWNYAEGRPRRGPGELFAYLGLDPIEIEPGVGVAKRRVKFQKSNWNGLARSRLRLMAEKCLIAGVRKPKGHVDEDGYDWQARWAITRYGQVYLDGRAKYADAVHQAPCPQCGGKKKPAAPVGSPLKDGHKKSRALRMVMRQIVKDIWNESQRTTNATTSMRRSSAGSHEVESQRTTGSATPKYPPSAGSPSTSSGADGPRSLRYPDAERPSAPPFRAAS